MWFDDEYSEVWHDRAGETVVFRWVRPDDKPLFEKGLSDLSPISIYNRFMSAKSEFTVAELGYLTEVDGWDHLALVGIKGEGRHERLVAVSRAARYPDRRDAMDFGLIVADCEQGLGLGRALLVRTAYAAKERETRFLCGEMFAGNSAMFHLADTFLAPADWILNGPVASFEIELERLPPIKSILKRER